MLFIYLWFVSVIILVNAIFYDLVFFTDSIDGTLIYAYASVYTMDMGLSRQLVNTGLNRQNLGNEYLSNWLNGIFDGGFTYHSEFRGNSVTFILSLKTNKLNWRILALLQQKLGVGTITEQSNSQCRYRIRSANPRLFLDNILPLIEATHLRSNRIYSFNIFKRMLLISADQGLDRTSKVTLIRDLNAQLRDPNISIPNSNGLDAAWFIGFSELHAEFKITSLAHCFNYTISYRVYEGLDILTKINNTFGLNGTLTQSGRWCTLLVNQPGIILNLLKFYRDKLFGIKSAEYRIWARSLENVLKSSTLKVNTISELTSNSHISHISQTYGYLNTKHINNVSYSFIERLVGFVDGDGSFHMIVSNQQYFNYVFSCLQSAYNCRFLCYIKQQLGNIGHLDKVSDTDHQLTYRIRERSLIIYDILPLFELYPLHTARKTFVYNVFKLGLFSESMAVKFLAKEILSTFNHGVPLGYELPAINNRLPSYSWIYGFTEAEGSFYITQHGSFYGFGYSITQKDRDILVKISMVVPFDCQIITKPFGVYELIVRDLPNLVKVINFYNNKLIGMKAAEYRIWRYAFTNYRLDHNKLRRTQAYMRYMRHHYKVSNYTKYNKNKH